MIATSCRCSLSLLAAAVLGAMPTLASAQSIRGFSIAAPAPPPASSEKFRTVARPIVGRYIVVLKKTAARMTDEKGTLPTVSSVADSMATAYGFTVVHRYNRVLRGFAVSANDSALAYLLADSRVEYVREDAVAKLAATQTGATWGLDRIDQRGLPLDGTYRYDTGAAGVHAYVIDSGIRGSHQEFAGRMGNGFTAIDDGRGTGDCSGHGTHVAGTVAGSTWGVAKAATVHPVRVFGCDDNGSAATIMAGVDWVVANHVKPAVANMSIQVEPEDPQIEAAVQRLIDAGVTVVAAAGNRNIDACNVSPGGLWSVLTVGASDRIDKRSVWQVVNPDEPVIDKSNYGTCVDLFAPGTDIVSAGVGSDTAQSTLNGTSMASPHVAGAAAIYLANNPSATPSQVSAAILGNTTGGRITDPGDGSNNRLLHIPASGNQPFRPEFSGGWYAPEKNGQGQVIEINPDLGMVFGGWYTFDASGQNSPAGQRWYTFQGPYTSTDTVRTFTVFRNTGGNFDAAPSTQAVPVGNVTLSFQGCGSAKLQYQIDLDGTQRNGTTALTRLDNNPNCLTGITPNYSYSRDGISPGLNGAWSEPGVDGQGVQVIASPGNDNLLFLAWYTYDVNGEWAPGATGQRWFTLQGNYRSGDRALYGMTILQTTGGRFDATPAASAPVSVGTADIEFHNCTSATLSYRFNDGRIGEIPLGRLTGGNCMD
jgi:subtilisin family serine protease